LREYNTPLAKATLSGLRKERVLPRNAGGLVACVNVFPRNGVFVPGNEISWPFEEYSQFVQWPYPHLIKGPSGLFIVYSDAIYSVSADNTLEGYTIYDLSNPAMAFSPSSTSSDQFHLADFGGGFWMLFRPDCTILNLNTAGMFGEDVQAYGQDIITMNTGVAFRGRLVVGGFNPANYWPVDWDSLIEHWTSQLEYQISTTVALHENFIMWSQIGGGDLLSMFQASSAVSGPLQEDERGLTDMIFIERLRRNELGFMPMPFAGTVHCIKELGNGLMVYGSNGIAYIFPVSTPVPTFGCRPLLNIGLLSRGAVGGDENQHLFIAEDGTAWLVTAEPKLTRLGYGEFLGELSNPIVCFDSLQSEFHISDVEVGYILTSDGLGGSFQQAMSVYNSPSGLIGTFNEAEVEEAILVTDVIDCGVRDLKTVTFIDLGITTEADVYVAVDYRYTKAGDFTRSPWVLVNDEGFARVQVTALEFRVCIKTSAITELQLDSINLRWQLSGRRTIRGFYDTAAGQ